jgi:uncharacterized protein DUF5994
VTIQSHVIADSNDWPVRGQDGSVAMTRKEDHVGAGRRHTPPAHTPRLRLKPKAPQSGYVDGAWWPHTEDLAAELPDLLSVLSVRLGPIGRVVYNLTDWRTTATELVTSGCAVQLDGYRCHTPNTVEVLDAEGNKIVLLVVPFNTGPDQAHAIVMAAAASGNVSRVDALLMISVKDREGRTKRAGARERWDLQAEPLLASSGREERSHRTIT